MTYILYTNGVIEKDGFEIVPDEFSQAYADYVAFIEANGVPESRPAEEYHAKEADIQQTRTRIRDEYINTIATLQQIEDAQSPTNVQVVAAVKFLAKTLRLLLKLIARQYS